VSAASSDCIVWFASRVILIPKSFDPLKKFKIILKTAFDEPVYRNRFIDVMLCENLLESLKVLDILVFVLCIELR